MSVFVEYAVLNIYMIQNDAEILTPFAVVVNTNEYNIAPVAKTRVTIANTSEQPDSVRRTKKSFVRLMLQG